MSTDVEAMCDRLAAMRGEFRSATLDAVLSEAAAMLRSLEDEAKVLLDNEVIYKAQIKNLHRLLGMMVNRMPGSAAYSEARAEAADLVLAAHMDGSTNGIANND